MRSSQHNVENITDQAIKFHPGEFVAYSAQGVGRVEAIEKRDIRGSQHDFYIIKTVCSNSLIMVPVQNAAAAGMRAIIREEDVEGVYKRITSNRNVIKDRHWNRRYRQYMSKIKSGDLYSIAEVYRDLYLLNQDKNLSFEQRKLIDMAKGLLVNEICIVMDENEQKISEEIESLFKS